MLYNDDETRQSEERFQEALKKIRSLTEEDKQKIADTLEKITAAAKELAAIPNPTKAEIELLVKIKEVAEQMTEETGVWLGVLTESLNRQANAYYNHIKKLAEEGNEDAKRIYEDLRPGYQDSLKDIINPN